MIEEGFIDEKYKHLAPLYNSKEDLINGLLNFKPLGIRTYKATCFGLLYL